MKTRYETGLTGLWTGLYNHCEKNQYDFITKKFINSEIIDI